jgi:general secretion pathway protein J
VKGFTLVEVMVALLIFGVVAAACTSLLGLAVDSRAAASARVGRIGEFQRARAILKTDLEQAAERPTRDENGVRSYGPITGGGDMALLAFVRRGLEETAAAPRPSLQFVEYRLNGDRLERRTRPMLDGAQLGQPQTLLTGVRSARLAFLERGAWSPAWMGQAGLPEAVRFDVDVAGVGPVTQLFLLPGGAR